MERTKMSNLRNGSKGNANPGSLDCESGILPLSYRAPRQLENVDTRSLSRTVDVIMHCFHHNARCYVMAYFHVIFGHISQW